MQRIFKEPHGSSTKRALRGDRHPGPVGGDNIKPLVSIGGSESSTRSRRWGVILADGDEARLRSLSRFVCGDDRPVQFCPLFGGGTLMEQTLWRAQKSIPLQQTLCAVTRAHEDYYLPGLGDAPCHRLVQPYNRGTAPPIVYSLLHIAEREPDAAIAILPCDHYYSDENAITLALESAFQTAISHPGSVVLLAAEPDAPEEEYGWIEVGSPVDETAFRVHALHEKPPLRAAQHLLRGGAFWNTFVMVGHINAFLRMAWESVPGLLQVFEIKMSASRHKDETRIPASAYEWFSTCDFSRRVLSRSVTQLLAVRLRGCRWDDLASPSRVLAALLARSSALPAWVDSWQAGFLP